MAERSEFVRPRISVRKDKQLFALLGLVFLMLIISSGGKLLALAGSDSWAGAVSVCTSPQLSTTNDCSFTAEVPDSATTEAGEGWNKTVWYKFVPASSAAVYIRATSDGYDNTLHLRNSAGTILTSNDDSYGLDAAVQYNLTSGTTYYVGVGSYRNSGIPSVAVRLTMSRPDPPTSVTATASGASGTINVSWTSADLTSRSITSFTVYAYSGGVQVSTRSVSGTPPSTSLSFTGLTNGTAYTFKVSATNSVNSSDLSAESAAATPYSPQTVTFNTLANKNYGDPSFTLSATTNAPGAVITFASTTSSVCTVESTTVTIVTVGTCSITATGSAVTGWSSVSTTRSFAVNAKALTVTGLTAASRFYDGSRSIAVTGTAALEGIVSTDAGNVTVSGTPVGTAATKNAGSQSVSVSGLSLSGSAASKYSLTSPTLTASINAKPLTVTAPTVQSRSYNGSRSINATLGTVSGFVGSENIVISASGQLDSANAGDRTATVSYALSNGANGELATNYSLDSNSVAVTITRRTLTVAGTSVAAKQYDNSRTATATLGTVSGYVGSERPVVTASAVFQSPLPGPQDVDVTYSVVDDLATGALGANYQVLPEVLTASISKATITFTVSARDRAYNGSANASLVLGAVSGIVNGDVVEVDMSKISGTFADEEVGLNKLVTLVLANGVLSGADAVKYTYVTPSNPRADINKANQTGFSITNSTTMAADETITIATTGGQTSGSVSLTLSSGACRLNGARLSAERGGTTCVVTATKPSDSRYNSATDTLTIRVDKVPQRIVFRSTAPSNAVVGGTYTVNVESDVSLAPTIVIANSSTAICSISAGVVTFNAVGTCLISASQAGSDVYASAAASQSVTVVAVPITTTTVAASGGNSSPTTAPTVTTMPQSAVARVPSSTSVPVAVPTTTTTTTTTLPADPTKPVLGANGQPVELAEGETTVLIRGEEVVVNTKQEDGQLVMELPNNVVVRIGAKTAGGSSVQVGADGVLRAYRNSQVAVELNGLVPGTTYTIYMFSTPIELGRGEVTGNGNVAQLVTLPTAAEIGSHTLQVNGVGPGGEVVSVSMGIKVEKKQSNTAAAITAISAAILLALLGGRPIFTRRRRRRDV